ncbi:3-oxoacyl-[acyl-carrier-protein] synthase III C-terminal domain-containing protein [Curtobacterium sp. MCPF17_031]|uniref:3-oxoacyl-[acyl-carrier-protein] synthase III C-terminal domain-containing protein n=1 Tax=Curtobacterium sp. MCPF17_031 TaxID=2175653 RepID=UPI000DA7E9AB|nr:3-oxoacyl-[acyl-carrier-protein] synthase III C-terminal domain-containing protein [Curtobacterium sp. MCPF17_031]PZE34235.1 3-oxoacyl-ACP synthase [Curtobacterium sp. MCPF17_031]
MTSIVDIGVHIPAQIALSDRQESLGLSDVELRRYKRGFGFDRVCFDASATEVDLLHRAVDDLEHFALAAERVKLVIRPRTIRSTSPYPLNPMLDLRRQLGLMEAQAFSITDQACASGLLAMELAGDLLEQCEDDALALILAGEKTYGASSQLIPSVAVLGEATAAVLVSARPGRNQMIGYAADTIAVPGSGLTMTDEALLVFGEIYSTSLLRVINAALEAAGLSVQDLDLYLPHNVSKIVGIRMGRTLGLQSEQIHTANIAETAHCFSADSFINLKSVMTEGSLGIGDFFLVTSVGIGATFAAAVFKH